MNTLLEQAKKIKSADKKREEISKQHIEIALAWVKGEITTGQYCGAVTGKQRTSYAKLYSVALALRQAYAEGLIKITK